MLWIIGILLFIVLGGALSSKDNPRQNSGYHTSDDLSEEEIEYDYLQRQQEEQDEEDYYLRQMNDKE